MQLLSILVSVWLNIASDFLDRAIAARSGARNLAFWASVIQFFLIVPLIGLVYPLRWDAVLLCALVGAVTAYGRIPWFRALSVEGQSLSRLSPFNRISGVVVLIGAVVLLGEPFIPTKFLGGCVVILGSIIVLLDEPLKTVRQLFERNKAPLWMTISAIANASVPLLYKFLVDKNYDLFSVFFYLKLFQALFILLSSTQGAIGALGPIDFAPFKIMVLSRILQTLAALMYLFALTKLDLGITEPVAALGPIFIFIMEALLRWARIGSERSEKPRLRVQGIQLASAGLVGLGLLLMLRNR